MTDATLTTPSQSTAGSPFQTRAYRFTAKDGVMVDSYVAGAPLSAFNWVKDPAAGAVWALSGAGGTIPAWQAPGTWHANIVFRGSCRGYFVKEAELKAALLAIKRAPDGLVEPVDPATGKPGVHPLFTPQNVDDLVGRIVDYTRLDGSQVSGKVAAFLTKVKELKTLLDGGFVISEGATTAEFYAKTETLAKIDKVFTMAATTLHAAAKKIYDDNVAPVDNFGGA